MLALRSFSGVIGLPNQRKKNAVQIPSWMISVRFDDWVIEHGFSLQCIGRKKNGAE